ncbi:hypothetical protein [Aquimarina sp. I32.4]|uniref:hypothetical protein n=1 Tax=Aquimarina sp. I32.4 TaxID=2053903 RepID=UPI000CDEC13D|nr:hypothetical protein [Aquimarina sp. I32.4]
MNKLIPQEDRIARLIKFGAPKLFIENIGKIPELEFRIEDVEGAYYYLPTISNYEVLKGFNVIPIYDEGESFYVVIYNAKTTKIIHFELENDEIYHDYNQNWCLLLMDIMIQYYEDVIDDGIEVINFINVAKKIDFHKAEKLFNLLDIPIEEYNIKYNEKEKWRVEIAKELEIL